jgi:hypothetical protein
MLIGGAMSRAIRARSFLLLGALLLGSVPESLAAQRDSTLVLGARVRAYHTDRCCGNPLVGAVISLTVDSLVVGAEEGARVALPRAALRSVERGYEVRPHAKNAPLLGLAMGAAAGAVAPLIATDCQDDEICGSMKPLFALIGAGVGSLVGGFVGMVVGQSMRREEWRMVRLPARVGISPIRGSAAIDVLVRF